MVKINYSITKMSFRRHEIGPKSCIVYLFFFFFFFFLLKFALVYGVIFYEFTGSHLAGLG